VDKLKAMAAFARVVEADGFTEAARTLGISRAMVSRLVQQLEDDLGTRLLNRTTRRLSVTEAGRAYYERCVALLDDLAQLDASVSESTQEARGVLRVNAPVTFGYLHLAPLIPEFLARHPRASIELTLNDRVVNLVEEGYDLALRIGRLADSSLVARRLAPIELVVCASPDYLARHGMPETPNDLAQHNCLGYTYAANVREWELERDGERRTVRVTGNFDANSGDAIRVAGLAGLGIMLQPTFIVGDDIRRGALVQLLDGWRAPPIALHAVYPHRRHLSSKVRLFIEFVAERFGDCPYWDTACATSGSSGAASRRRSGSGRSR
jgi:DNA-binding transcriptional LysR family regulator